MTDTDMKTGIDETENQQDTTPVQNAPEAAPAAAPEAPKPTAFCSECGKPISREAVICPFCGVPTPKFHQQQQQQPVINVVNTNTNSNVNVNRNGMGYIRKKKWPAFFLCLFLGIFGGHRFYVGKTGSAVLYLFTFGLWGIGALVDLILILCGGFRDKMGQPLE